MVLVQPSAVILYKADDTVTPPLAACQVAFPLASEVSTLPAPAPLVSWKPVAFTIPFTSSFCPGFVVPIPTLPLGTRSTLPVPEIPRPFTVRLPVLISPVGLVVSGAYASPAGGAEEGSLKAARL